MPQKDTRSKTGFFFAVKAVELAVETEKRHHRAYRRRDPRYAEHLEGRRPRLPRGTSTEGTQPRPGRPGPPCPPKATPAPASPGCSAAKQKGRRKTYMAYRRRRRKSIGLVSACGWGSNGTAMIHPSDFTPVKSTQVPRLYFVCKLEERRETWRRSLFRFLLGSGG